MSNISVEWTNISPQTLSIHNNKQFYFHIFYILVFIYKQSLILALNPSKYYARKDQFVFASRYLTIRLDSMVQSK